MYHIYRLVDIYLTFCKLTQDSTNTTCAGDMVSVQCISVYNISIKAHA